jgi:hypothetical protein
LGDARFLLLRRHKGGGDAPGQPEGNLNDCDFKVTILDARNSGIPRTT